MTKFNTLCKDSFQALRCAGWPLHAGLREGLSRADAEEVPREWKSPNLIGYFNPFSTSSDLSTLLVGIWRLRKWIKVPTGSPNLFSQIGNLLVRFLWLFHGIACDLATNYKMSQFLFWTRNVLKKGNKPGKPGWWYKTQHKSLGFAGRRRFSRKTSF